MMWQCGCKIKFNMFSLYATVLEYERPNCHVASTTLKFVLSNTNNEREYNINLSKSAQHHNVDQHAFP